MNTNPKKLPFTQLMVSIMPKKEGIYTFWDRNGNVIYIGQAEKPNNLFHHLNDHFTNEHQITIEGIYDFQIEVCRDPGRRQIQLLEEHEKTYGCLPDFNKMIGAKVRGE